MRRRKIYFFESVKFVRISMGLELEKKIFAVNKKMRGHTKKKKMEKPSVKKILIYCDKISPFPSGKSSIYARTK